MATEKIIIIGSGPAGLSAAIYAARGNLRPLVIAGRNFGGQLMLTTDVDDFPGFPKGIQGPVLMAAMRKQAERFKTRFLEEDVLSVNFKKKPFVVQTETKKLTAKTVILATGASAMWLGLSSEQRLIGKGVSACAVCDGFFFKDKEVLVVGGGDTAIREAQYLSKYCKSVTIVHRRGILRAQPALVGVIKKYSKVKFLFNTVVEEVLGGERVEAVKLKDTVSGKVRIKPIEGIFIAIGHKPNTDFLKGEIKLDENGYVLAKRETETSIKGVFFAGDVADRKYKQAAVAAGMGVKAALDVEDYLSQVELPSEGVLTSYQK